MKTCYTLKHSQHKSQTDLLLWAISQFLQFACYSVISCEYYIHTLFNVYYSFSTKLWFSKHQNQLKTVRIDVCIQQIFCFENIGESHFALPYGKAPMLLVGQCRYKTGLNQFNSDGCRTTHLVNCSFIVLARNLWRILNSTLFHNKISSKALLSS